MNKTSHTVNRRIFLAAASVSSAVGSFLMTKRSIRAAGKISKNAPSFRAGAAVTRITPDPGVSLDGYFQKQGPIKAVHDDLYARALVLDDGKQRIAFCVCDMTKINGEFFDRAKKIVQQETGMPSTHMMMSATHTHSAPRAGVGKKEIDKKFYKMLVQQIAAAVIQATRQLAPAKIGWGFGRKPEYCHNRRWWVKPNTIPPNPFGEKTDRIRWNPLRASKNLIRPAGPVDPEVGVLSVQHADGTPMAVLANYSIHYAGGFKRGYVSADYFGVFSRQMAKRFSSGKDRPPFIGVMSNGTSGNISRGIDFRKKQKKYSHWKWMEEIGIALAEEVSRVVQRIEHRSNVSVAMREKDINIGIRHPNKDRLEWARNVLAQGKKKWLHHRTPIYASEALLLNQYPKTVSVKLQAARVGNLLIGAIPCEVFAETGLALKDLSPSDDTFIIELANQYHGYLPTPEQHLLGGYETWDARSSCLEQFADPKIRSTIIELFHQLVV